MPTYRRRSLKRLAEAERPNNNNDMDVDVSLDSPPKRKRSRIDYDFPRWSEQLSDNPWQELTRMALPDFKQEQKHFNLTEKKLLEMYLIVKTQLESREEHFRDVQRQFLHLSSELTGELTEDEVETLLQLAELFEEHPIALNIYNNQQPLEAACRWANNAVNGDEPNWKLVERVIVAAKQNGDPELDYEAVVEALQLRKSKRKADLERSFIAGLEIEGSKKAPANTTKKSLQQTFDQIVEEDASIVQEERERTDHIAELQAFLETKLRQKLKKIDDKKLQELKAKQMEAAPLKDDTLESLCNQVWEKYEDQLVQDSIKQPDPAQFARDVCKTVFKKAEINRVLARVNLEVEKANEAKKKATLTNESLEQHLTLDLEVVREWIEQSEESGKHLVPAQNIPSNLLTVDAWVSGQDDESLKIALVDTGKATRLHAWTNSFIFVELVRRKICQARNQTTLDAKPNVKELEVALEDLQIGKRSAYYNNENRVLLYYSLRQLVTVGLGLRGFGAENAMNYFASHIHPAQFANADLRKRLMTWLSEKLQDICQVGGLEFHSDSVINVSGYKDRFKTITQALDTPD